MTDEIFLGSFPANGYTSCCSSVVERTLGKGKVESSILSSSTILPLSTNELSTYLSRPFAWGKAGAYMFVGVGPRLGRGRGIGGMLSAVCVAVGAGVAANWARRSFLRSLRRSRLVVSS